MFFLCGESLSAKGMTYLTNSLFDYRSPENNGVDAEFILDANLHKVSALHLNMFNSTPTYSIYMNETYTFVCSGIVL